MTDLDKYVTVQAQPSGIRLILMEETKRRRSCGTTMMTTTKNKPVSLADLPTYKEDADNG